MAPLDPSRNMYMNRSYIENKPVCTVHKRGVVQFHLHNSCLQGLMRERVTRERSLADIVIIAVGCAAEAHVVAAKAHVVAAKAHIAAGRAHIAAGKAHTNASEVHTNASEVARMVMTSAVTESVSRAAAFDHATAEAVGADKIATHTAALSADPASVTEKAAAASHATAGASAVSAAVSVIVNDRSDNSRISKIQDRDGLTYIILPASERPQQFLGFIPYGV